MDKQKQNIFCRVDCGNGESHTVIVTKMPCGTICTPEECKTCEEEELGGYCVLLHTEKENLEKALEVYSDEKSLEKYPFCYIVGQALKEKQERSNPKPLTYKELKEHAGKPVYTVFKNGYDWNTWGIVAVVNNIVVIHCYVKDIFPRQVENRMMFYDYEPKEG